MRAFYALASLLLLSLCTLLLLLLLMTLTIAGICIDWETRLCPEYDDALARPREPEFRLPICWFACGDMKPPEIRLCRLVPLPSL